LATLQIPPRRYHNGHREKWSAYCQRVLDTLQINEITPKNLGLMIGKSPIKAGQILREEMTGWKKFNLGNGLRVYRRIYDH